MMFYHHSKNSPNGPVPTVNGLLPKKRRSHAGGFNFNLSRARTRSQQSISTSGQLEALAIESTSVTATPSPLNQQSGAVTPQNDSGEVRYLPSIAAAVHTKDDGSTSSNSKSSSSTSTKTSSSTVDELPPKALLKRSRQVPGRYFPAPSLNEAQKHFLRSSRQRTSPRCYTAAGNMQMKIAPIRNKPNSATDSSDLLNNSNRFQKIPPNTPRTLRNNFVRGDDEDEIYTISFRNGEQPSGTGYYDPGSELRSDYYTVEKLVTTPVSPRQNVTPGPQNFSGCLEGTTKLLHQRE